MLYQTLGMRKMADHDDVLSVHEISFQLKGIHLAARAVGQVDWLVVTRAHRIELVLLRIPGIKRRDAKRCFLEAPRLRELRHLAKLAITQIAFVHALRTATRRPSDAHSRIGIDV